MIKKVLLSILFVLSMASVFAETCSSSEYSSWWGTGWYCGSVQGPAMSSSVEDASVYVKINMDEHEEVRCVNNNTLRYSTFLESQAITLFGYDEGYIRGNLHVAFCKDKAGSDCEEQSGVHSVTMSGKQLQVAINITGAKPEFFGCTPDWQE